ncbi:unnamed protein product [Ectocarpus sp. 4 AP-2014]
MMAPATTSLAFCPGPLGLELEPVWEAGGRAIGCRVAGFKSSPDGSAGQGQRTGAVRPGDVLTGVGDVPVGDMSFEKIVALLRHRSTRLERRLTFQSSLPATTKNPTPPPRSPRTWIQQQASLMFVVESNDTTVASSGERTEPATPSPEAQPRPVGVTNGEVVDHQPADRVGSRAEEHQHRLGWASPADGVDMVTAQTLKSAPEGTGMGEEDDGSAWWKSAQQVGLDQGSDDDNTAASDTLSGVEYFCPDGHAAATMMDLAAVAVGVSGSPENGQDSLSQGLAQVLYEAGLVPEACRQEDNGMDVLAPAAASDSSAPEHVEDGGNAGQQCGNPTPTHGLTGGLSLSGQVAGDEERRLLPADSTSAADAQDPPVPACGPSQHQPQRHTPAVFSLEAIAPASPGDVAVGPSSTVSRISTGLDGRRDRGAHGFYAGYGGRLPLNTSPETVDRSFDTVSLRSEPTVYAKEASSKQRISILTSLWGGGRGDSGAASSPAPENGKGEVEEARRLARSLAVKLKERARRCEELEDLFGLRDHQVSMLQRQSNSLAARAASLADDLSDKSALIEALQLDRSRLERELAQSRLRHEEDVDAARGDDGSGQRLAESGACGDESSLSRPEGSGAATATAVAATPEVDSEAAVALAAAVKAAERKAAAAEARSLAFAEMVDGLVAGKVGWEEERAARAAEALRLRALVRGLEEAAALAGEEGGGRKQVEGLRELLRERTRELEAKSVAMERLAVHTRELEEDNRRLGVSLSAREGDIFVSDKQMRALSARLKAEVRVSGEATARAEAVAGELRKALEEATAAAAAAVAVGSGEAEKNAASPSGAATRADEESGEGFTDRPSIGNRVEWAEERARLQHNLMSLREALEDRERQVEADEAAMSSRLKAARDDRDRSAREKGNLREAVDSLRMELAEALALAASYSGRSDGGVFFGGKGALGAFGVTSGSVAAAGGDNNGCGGERVGGARSDGRCEEGLQERESEGGDGETEVSGGDAVAVKVQKGAAEAEGPEHRRGDVVSGGAPATASGARDRWLDGGFEGTIGETLDLMEKDIVIEQLRTQLKQLRSRIAVMEEDQAADTAPLQGLLNQLGELKGSVEEREEREQQCRDQVDLGLLRMERLKEESTAATAAAAATAAVASPPVSFAGWPGAPQLISAQADPSRGQAQAELQRLRRQLEDLQWDARTLKRRIEERDNQVRDARAEADGVKARSRTAERELGGAQGELAVAAAEVAAERRKTSALRAELQSSRAELQSVHDRAASAAAAAERSAEEQRSWLEQEGRDRLSAAAAAEARARDRVAELSASLGAATAERDALLLSAKAAGEEAALVAAPKQGFDPAVEEGTARAREVESLRCALAARDVELESIIDATAGFSHHTVGLGGSGALRGALAAATEARRVGRLVAELEEECSSLKAKVTEERADARRLREALEQARLAEQRATAAASAATAAAATARRPSPSPSQDTGGGKDREGGHSAAEAQAMSKRVQEAENALQKALAGAQRAWGVVSSCLSDDDSSGVDDDDGTVSTPTPPALPPAMASFLLWQHPASPVDPSLGALICGVEALAAAYRRRGHAARRATVAARAKAVCAREARRREEAEIRAREDAEGRLEEAMIALDDYRRCHEQQQQQQQTCWGVGRAADGPGPGGGMPGDGGGGRSFLSHEQEEHLRQIRSEVDRLEGQNQTLRRSLESGSVRLIGKMTELYRETGGGNRGDLPTQRLLFPPSSATGGNNTEEGGPRANLRAGRWERADGLSGRGASATTPSPSPGRSWTAPSNTHARGSPCYRRGGDGDGPGQEDEDDNQEEARARVLQEFAGCCAAPQDDGSGGTLVPVWGNET